MFGLGRLGPGPKNFESRQYIMTETIVLRGLKKGFSNEVAAVSSGAATI